MLSVAPQMLLDINLDTESSYPGSFPESFVDVNGTTFFSAVDANSGNELWKSDGTPEGTVMVKDIRPGSASSSPNQLTEFNGRLVFTAHDGTHGFELWSSDGTPENTFMLKDIQSGPISGWGDKFLVVGGTLYFNAEDGIHGSELWKTDGTAEGTVLVKDIKPGSGGSSIARLMDFGGKLFFSANDGSNGKEIWTTDGTEAGTVMLKNINPGAGHGAYLSPFTTIIVGQTLYFFASDGEHGSEIWKSDGTESGTMMVKDINPGPGGSSNGVWQMTAVGATVYFTATNTSNLLDRELWKTDGTEAGTVVLTEFDVPTSQTAFSSWNLTAVGETLYFTPNDPTAGKELWKTTGTPEGTRWSRISSRVLFGPSPGVSGTLAGRSISASMTGSMEGRPGRATGRRPAR